MQDAKLVTQQEYFKVFLLVGQAAGGKDIEEQPEDVQDQVNIGVHGASIRGTVRLHKGFATHQMYICTLQPKYLIRDNDCKFGANFDRVALSSGIEVLRTPYKAPRANAFCERLLGSVRRECLDHMLILGEKHLHKVIKEYVGYYNSARPHQGIGQAIPQESEPYVQKAPPGSNVANGKVISFPVLGGLHHDYRRAA